MGKIIWKNYSNQLYVYVHIRRNIEEAWSYRKRELYAILWFFFNYKKEPGKTSKSITWQA